MQINGCPYGRNIKSPISAKEYTDAGLWFDYYDEDKEAIDGALKLGKAKSASEILSKNISNEINKSNPFFLRVKLIKRRMKTTRYLNEKVSNPKSGW